MDLNKLNINKKYSSSLNKFMHPRNPYKKIANFKNLAIEYPEFRAFCTYDISGKVHLDFKNKSAVKALTTCLLKHDFQLDICIPDESLVPTLPLRFNYLLWLEDLLHLVNTKKKNTQQSVVGLDIGTGAAAIYPILGHKKLNWNFVATESDSLNYQNAKDNLSRNNLDSVILLKDCQHEDLFAVLKQDDVINFVQNIKCQTKDKTSPNTRIDFTMCNPPFFASEDEMEPNFGSRSLNRSEPNSASTGCAQERVTEGGEIAFISNMFDMSRQFKDQVRIFSSLVGKKCDVKSVIRLIKEKEPAVHITQAELCQGKTMRWVIAWTFDGDTTIERMLSRKEILTSKPVVWRIPRTQMTVYNVNEVWTKVTSWLKDIKIKPSVFKKYNRYIGATIRAYKATWLHQRRQQRKKKQILTTGSQPTTSVVEIETSNEMEVDEVEEKNETLEEESSDDERESPLAKRARMDTDTPSSELISSAAPSAGLPCLLRCTIHVRHVENLISVEMARTGGTASGDALNQLIQYLRNKLI